MTTERTRDKANRAAQDRERHERLREKYKHRPSQEELLATGDHEGPAPLGVFLEMRLAVAELRKARNAASLSLTQVAERSGIDKAALSRLERGLQPNPTIETLCRYAAALGKRVVWQLAEDPNFPAPPQTPLASLHLKVADEPVPLEESRRKLDALSRWLRAVTEGTEQLVRPVNGFPVGLVDFQDQRRWSAATDRLRQAMKLIGSADLELNDVMKRLGDPSHHGGRVTRKGKTSK